MIDGYLDVLFPLVLVVGGGCCTAGDRAVLVVKEGRALLRHPAPSDPDWEKDRRVFLGDADAVIGSGS